MESRRERYRAIGDVQRIPAGGGMELVLSPLSPAPRLLPSPVIALLAECGGPAPMEQHARTLAARRGGASAIEPISRALQDLVDAGALVSETALLTYCAGGPSAGGAAQLRSIGIPTADRPESLGATLDSFGENTRAAGRDVEYIVVDSSSTPDLRAAVRGVAAAFAAKHAVRTRYAGPEQIARHAESLARRAGVPLDLVELLLVDRERVAFTAGKNRNALLLDTAGEVTAQVDDDARCRLSRAPETEQGLALAAGRDPSERWFLTPDVAPERAFPEEPASFCDIHEELLGKSVAEIVAGHPAGQVDTSRMRAVFAQRLHRAGGRVLVTATGLAGDSASGSSGALLTLDGPSRERLHASEAMYRHAFTSRRVVRAARRATVTEPSFCVAFNVGLDNRSLLPPFGPVGRNDDGVFGALLRKCAAGACTGLLPWILPHLPPEPRACPFDEFFAVTAGQFRFADIVMALVRSARTGADGAGMAENLRSLGAHLVDLGRMPPADFREIARAEVRHAMASWIGLTEAMLARHQGQPTYLARDCQKLIVALQKALVRGSLGVPDDLSGWFGADRAEVLCQDLTARLGASLIAWPALVEAAKELSARGERASEPV